MAADTFFREYTSSDAITKYTRGTAGFGISYLLDHDYKAIYLKALDLLPPDVKQRGIRVLEFGCGAGMNLLHLVGVLNREGVKVLQGVGTDFSPVLIDTAKREAKDYLPDVDRQRIEFYVARNETLMEDLSPVLGKSRSEMEESFDFILGINTIRYCHREKKEMDCAQAIFDLLVPRGVCVVIDMNDRFPLFRSALKDRLRGEDRSKPDYYLPSLQEYARPFAETGFEVLRKEHFCWIPHSSGPFMCQILRLLSPVLDTLAGSRAMRSLVLARKPACHGTAGARASK
ncbi:MAG TPA: class I SAM-dependent methyltransferase [Terriglobales bacterium]|nr:class I SAM-dependent methyltransferase [Terriglobales bacterium]